MTQPVVRAWPAIDRAVTKELNRIGEPIESALSHLNPRGGYLGTGAWGAVYQTMAGRWVVKVTADPTEGPITSAIMSKPSLRAHPGVAYFLKIWRLAEPAPFHGKRYTIYVIVRENIKPISYYAFADDYVARRARKILVGSNTKTDMGHRGTAFEINTAIEKGDTRAIETLGWRWDQEILELRNLYPSHMMADFMGDFFASFKGALADVHTNNFGLREHALYDLKLPKDVIESHEPASYWVLFDPGHSSVATGSKPPLLPVKNPGRPIPVLPQAWTVNPAQGRRVLLTVDWLTPQLERRPMTVAELRRAFAQDYGVDISSSYLRTVLREWGYTRHAGRPARWSI